MVGGFEGEGAGLAEGVGDVIALDKNAKHGFQICAYQKSAASITFAFCRTVWNSNSENQLDSFTSTTASSTSLSPSIPPHTPLYTPY